MSKYVPGSLVLNLQIHGLDAAYLLLSADGVDLSSIDVFRLKVTLEYEKWSW